ncbi:hypothetical protein [Salinicola halophyticus]|uniref:hypothetical protein n=1 Tax=Salinicola halophyticus TaxID=1808881 RepID=UPI003F4687EF
MTIERSAITVHPYSIEQNRPENNLDAEMKPAGDSGCWSIVPPPSLKAAPLGKELLWMTLHVRLESRHGGLHIVTERLGRLEVSAARQLLHLFIVVGNLTILPQASSHAGQILLGLLRIVAAGNVVIDLLRLLADMLHQAIRGAFEIVCSRLSRSEYSADHSGISNISFKIQRSIHF